MPVVGCYISHAMQDHIMPHLPGLRSRTVTSWNTVKVHGKHVLNNGRHSIVLVCYCSQQRTPVDEVLGKEFQDSMLAIIDSFQTPAPPGALDPEDPEVTMPAQPALR